MQRRESNNQLDTSVSRDLTNCSIALGYRSDVHGEKTHTTQGCSPTVLKLSEIKSKPMWEIKWIEEILEQSYEAIKQEYTSLIQLFKDRQDLVGALTDSITASVNKGGSWTTNYFLEEGVWNSDLCNLCPNTSNVLKKLPICECALGYAYFSIIKPGTHIKPHHGCSNCKLRIQLPIQVSNSCKITIDGETYKYIPGRPLIFDDSFRHEVNFPKEAAGGDNNELDRVVLLIDVWNPQLSQSAVDQISKAFLPLDPKHQQQQCIMNNSSNASCELEVLNYVPNFNKQLRIQATGEITQDYDYLFKYLLIGDSGVGKSSFLLKYVDDIFTDSYISTIGVDFKIKIVMIEEKTIKLQIWDTAGPERFKTITSSYYKGAHAILLVYDVTDKETFDHVRHWHSETIKYASPFVLICLIGTKMDDHPSPLINRRQVTYEQGEALAKELNISLFFECSSKTGFNIESAIQETTRSMQALATNPEYRERFKNWTNAKKREAEDKNNRKPRCTIS